MASDALLPAYLVLGTNELKRQRVIAKMKARLEASGMLDFNLDERELSADTPIDDIVSSLNTFPMGADFRLVILYGCDRLPKTISEPLIDYLASPAATTVCLLVAGSLAKNTRLYKAIAALGKQAILDCSPTKAYELPRLAIKQMQGLYQKQLDMSAAQELITRIGDDERLLATTLERLAQQVNVPQVSKHDIERLVARTAEAQPWPFLDAVSARDAKQAMLLLRRMPQGSEVYLQSLVVRRLRELLIAQCLDERRESGSLSKRLGRQDWQVKHHIHWARGFSHDELINALRTAADLEQTLKGSGDSALAFELWVMNICTKQSV
ncbi:DNA polymerase III subunit delta [Collinsella sp. zg1085]|nr:DNA polymerase III subunit delta [Collinsella sp. zg1085]